MRVTGGSGLTVPLRPVGPALREPWLLLPLYGEERDARFPPISADEQTGANLVSANCLASLPSTICLLELVEPG